MMAIVTKCTQSPNGKYYLIELSDNKKGTGFNDLTDKIGKEVDLDIKEAKEYNGIMQYYINLPKEQKSAGGGKFPAKDYSYIKRESSLKFAIDSLKLVNQAVSRDKVIELAEYYFEYLNKK